MEFAFALSEKQVWAMPLLYLINWDKWAQWWCHHHPTLMGLRTCMKTSTVLEMQHFLGYQNNIWHMQVKSLA